MCAGVPGVCSGVPGMCGGVRGMCAGVPGMCGGVPGMCGGVPGMCAGVPGMCGCGPGMCAGGPGMCEGSIILLFLSFQPPDGPASFHGSPSISISTPVSTPYFATTPQPTRAVPLVHGAAVTLLVATTVGVVGGVIIVIVVIVVCIVVGVAHARRSGNNSRYGRNCIGFVLHPSLTTFHTLEDEGRCF